MTNPVIFILYLCFYFCCYCRTLNGTQRPGCMRSAGLSTRCDFIRLKATAKAKRVAEYAVVCPAAVLQLCYRLGLYIR